MGRLNISLMVLVILAAASLSAATIESQGNGYWFTASTWSGGVVPTEADNVIIRIGDTVTVDWSPQDSCTASCSSIQVNGAIQFTYDQYYRPGGITVTGSFVNNGTVTPQFSKYLVTSENYEINAGGDFINRDAFVPEVVSQDGKQKMYMFVSMAGNSTLAADGLTHIRFLDIDGPVTMTGNLTCNSLQLQGFMDVSSGTVTIPDNGVISRYDSRGISTSPIFGKNITVVYDNQEKMKSGPELDPVLKYLGLGANTVLRTRGARISRATFLSTICLSAMQQR